MLFPAEQAFVGRDEKRAPLKTPAWEATSATERQKFHTDDVKSLRNPVRSPDWSTE